MDQFQQVTHISLLVFVTHSFKLSLELKLINAIRYTKIQTWNFSQMEGFQEFEARRKKKFDKQIDSNVIISSKGLDEGVDLWYWLTFDVNVCL